MVDIVSTQINLKIKSISQLLNYILILFFILNSCNKDYLIFENKTFGFLALKHETCIKDLTHFP
jgi:hypothetical protein